VGRPERWKVEWLKMHCCAQARLYTFAMNVTVFISTWVLVIETLAPQYTLVWFLMDTAFVAFFTFDLLVRMFSAPSQKAFWSNSLNLLDFITTFPYYIQISSGLMYNTGYGMQRCLRAFRHMKLIKVTKFGPVMLALESAMIKSLAALIVPIFYMMLALVVLSSLEYFIELDQPPDGINNPEDEGWDPFDRPTYDDLPSSIWWCLVTMTGTGYGDMYPSDWRGMMVAAFTAAIGVFFIAMPFAVAGGAFWSAWSIYIEQRELLRLMKEGDTSIELTADELGFQPAREIKLLGQWFSSMVRFADISQLEDGKAPADDVHVEGVVTEINEFVTTLIDMLATMHQERRHMLVIREWNRARESSIEERLPMPPKPEEISEAEARKASRESEVPFVLGEGGKDSVTDNPLNELEDQPFDGNSSTAGVVGENLNASSALESRNASSALLGGVEIPTTDVEIAAPAPEGQDGSD
jgi:hypothetical protein